MVVSVYPNWQRIWKQIGLSWTLMVALSIVASLLSVYNHPFRPISLPNTTITLLGAALGILLGFRTNSAYDRWWEARKLWGLLVNYSRTLARQAVAFTPPRGEIGSNPISSFARCLVYQHVAFVHALRCMLRRQEPWKELKPFLDDSTLEELRDERNVPAAILQRMGEMSTRAAEDGTINEWRLQQLDSTFTELANVQGACERIKNTPLPRQYDFYPELFVKTYCVLLPLVLVDEMKLWTPLPTAIVSFAFLVLNRIGKNLEDPFENTVYDTPMTSLSRTIEINLRQVLREKNVPDFLKPENGVLF